jgi:hypothetical protein
MSDEIGQPANEELASLKDVFNAIERLQAEGLEWTAAIKAVSGHDMLLPVGHICDAFEDGGVYLQTIFTLANPVTKEVAQIFFEQSGKGVHKEGGEGIHKDGRSYLEKFKLGNPTAVTSGMPLKKYLDASKSNPQP